MSTDNNVDRVLVSEGTRNMTKGIITKDEILKLEQEQIELGKKKMAIDMEMSALNATLHQNRFKQDSQIYKNAADARRKNIAKMQTISVRLADIAFAIKSARHDPDWNEGSRVMEKLKAIEGRLDDVDKTLARILRHLENSKV